MCKRDYDIGIAQGLSFHADVDEANQTLVLSPAAEESTQSMFGYLGGVDNGFIDVIDIERFLRARMPARKTKFNQDAPLLQYIKENF